MLFKFYYLMIVLCLVSCAKKSKENSIQKSFPNVKSILSYDSLCKKKVKIEKISNKNLYFFDSLSFIKGEDKIDSIRISILKIHNLDIPLSISKKAWTGDSEIYRYHKSQIKISTSSFVLDSISSFIPKSPTDFNIGNGGIYKMGFRNKLYLVFFSKNLNINTSNPSFLLYLFDITDKNNPKFIFADYQYFYDPSCFCDFNNDEKLEYISWEWKADTLKTFNLIKDTIIRDNNFLLINPDSFIIDWKNSNWY